MPPLFQKAYIHIGIRLRLKHEQYFKNTGECEHKVCWDDSKDILSLEIHSWAVKLELINPGLSKTQLMLRRFCCEQGRFQNAWGTFDFVHVSLLWLLGTASASVPHAERQQSSRTWAVMVIGGEREPGQSGIRWEEGRMVISMAADSKLWPIL